MTVFAATARARRSVADLLDTLDDARLATPSLCAGWSVKVVAGHLAAAVATPTGTFLRELLRQRGNGHKTNTVLARGRTALLPALTGAGVLVLAGRRERGGDGRAAVVDRLRTSLSRCAPRRRFRPTV